VGILRLNGSGCGRVRVCMTGGDGGGCGADVTVEDLRIEVGLCCFPTGSLPICGLRVHVTCIGIGLGRFCSLARSVIYVRSCTNTASFIGFS
jgi:hypothetical protein